MSTPAESQKTSQEVTLACKQFMDEIGSKQKKQLLQSVRDSCRNLSEQTILLDEGHVRLNLLAAHLHAESKEVERCFHSNEGKVDDNDVDEASAEAAQYNADCLKLAEVLTEHGNKTKNAMEGIHSILDGVLADALRSLKQQTDAIIRDEEINKTINDTFDRLVRRKATMQDLANITDSSRATPVPSENITNLAVDNDTSTPGSGGNWLEGASSSRQTTRSSIGSKTVASSSRRSSRGRGSTGGIMDASTGFSSSLAASDSELRAKGILSDDPIAADSSRSTRRSSRTTKAPQAGTQPSHQLGEEETDSSSDERFVSMLKKQEIENPSAIHADVNMEDSSKGDVKSVNVEQNPPMKKYGTKRKRESDSLLHKGDNQWPEAVDIVADTIEQVEDDYSEDEDLYSQQQPRNEEEQVKALSQYPKSAFLNDLKENLREEVLPLGKIAPGTLPVNTGNNSSSSALAAVSLAFLPSHLQDAISAGTYEGKVDPAVNTRRPLNALSPSQHTRRYSESSVEGEPSPSPKTVVASENNIANAASGANVRRSQFSKGDSLQSIDKQLPSYSQGAILPTYDAMDITSDTGAAGEAEGEEGDDDADAETATQSQSAIHEDANAGKQADNIENAVDLT